MISSGASATFARTHDVERRDALISVVGVAASHVRDAAPDRVRCYGARR